jgi:hypothetical protein
MEKMPMDEGSEHGNATPVRRADSIAITAIRPRLHMHTALDGLTKISQHHLRQPGEVP